MTVVQAPVQLHFLTVQSFDNAMQHSMCWTWGDLYFDILPAEKITRSVNAHCQQLCVDTFHARWLRSLYFISLQLGGSTLAKGGLHKSE